MDGRAFLDSARQLVPGQSEADWRTAASRAYYALFREARAVLRRWGFVAPRSDPIHAWVRLRLVFAKDADLNLVGDRLDKLGRLRNQADYQTERPGPFTDATEVGLAIRIADDTISLLDQLDADPARRAAAVAAVRGTITP